MTLVYALKITKLCVYCNNHFSLEKSKRWNNISRKLKKIKLKKSAQIRVFNFFSFFLLQNYFIRSKDTRMLLSCFLLFSFFINPQETPNSREKTRISLNLRRTKKMIPNSWSISQIILESVVNIVEKRYI